MEFASFLKLLSQTDGFGCGFFVFGCFSQIFNLVFLCFLLVLGLRFLQFKVPSSFVQCLQKIDLISPKIDSCSSFDRVHKDCNNEGFISKSYLVDELDQKKPIILDWTTDSADELTLRKKTKKSCEDCDLLLLRDENRNDSTEVLPETELDEENHHSEEEGSEDVSQSDEDQVFDVITLRRMVKRERKRGDCLKRELEKERRAAESATEEAMAMLLKLRLEKSVVEMEAKQYMRVAEQKQVYDQEVIQSLQWMLMKLDDQPREIGI